MFAQRLIAECKRNFQEQEGQISERQNLALKILQEKETSLQVVPGQKCIYCIFGDYACAFYNS